MFIPPTLRFLFWSCLNNSQHNAELPSNWWFESLFFAGSIYNPCIRFWGTYWEYEQWWLFDGIVYPILLMEEIWPTSWWFTGLYKSQVVQDFFHQQYIYLSCQIYIYIYIHTYTYMACISYEFLWYLLKDPSIIWNSHTCSKRVKFVPFRQKDPPKGRNFTYLEDPGFVLVGEMLVKSMVTPKDS